MRLLKKLLGSLMLAATIVGPIFGPTTAHAQSTPAVYWGAYLEDAPFDTSRIDKFEADAGKKESIVHWAQPWSMNGGYQDFQTAQYEKVRLRGSIPMIGWGSWALGGSATSQPSYQLADIYNGAHDAYITEWAKAAKAWGHPFFLRFDHEMNGWWYPWSEQTNGNHAGDFVKAWRHTVNIFRSVGATNATWVWCPNLTSSRSTPVSEMYPGDTYVDWTCMDGYNWGTDRGNTWLSFDKVFGVNPWTNHNTYRDILAVAPHKPMMIGEVATSKNGGDPATWIKDMLTVQLPHHYQAVRALVWFNWNAGDPSLEWPIESTSGMQSAFKSSIASGYYASNQFAHLPSGPIHAPSTTAPKTAQKTPPAASGSVTLPDIADTFIYGKQPDSNDGGFSRSVRSDGSPYQVAYVMFDLSGLSGKTITSARLGIRTTNDVGAGTASPQKIMFVNNDDWHQQWMTWDNSVPISSLQLGLLTAPKQSTWYAANLSVHGVQPNLGSNLTLAIVPTSNDGIIFWAREAGEGNAPQLALTYR